MTPLTLPGDDDLVPVLPPDWSGTVRVSTSWMTDISRSATTLAEERRELRSRPVRSVEYDVVGPARGVAFRMRSFLLRRGRARNPVPLWSDLAETTGTASGTNVPCITTHRRFYAGGRVAIYEGAEGGVSRDLGPDEDKAEYALIDSLTSSALTLKGSTALTRTYPAGSVVVPLFDAEIPAAEEGGSDAALRLLSDEIAAATVMATEVLGTSAMPGEAAGLPSGFPTEGGYPILDIWTDWSAEQEEFVIRDGMVQDTGLTSHVWAQAEEPRHGFRLTFSSLGRERAYDLRRFFDSRRGRCHPFWLPSPHGHFLVEEIGGDEHVEVTHDPYFDFTAVSKMAFILEDGSVEIYTLDSHTVADGFRRLTFTTNVTGFSPSEVVRLVPLHFVRLASDTLEEEWESSEVARIYLDCVEIQDETEIEIEDL